jgi:hypothetical protein
MRACTNNVPSVNNAQRTEGVCMYFLLLRCPLFKPFETVVVRVIYYSTYKIFIAVVTFFLKSLNRKEV